MSCRYQMIFHITSQSIIVKIILSVLIIWVNNYVYIRTLSDKSSSWMLPFMISIRHKKSWMHFQNIKNTFSLGKFGKLSLWKLFSKLGQNLGHWPEWEIFEIFYARILATLGNFDVKTLLIILTSKFLNKLNHFKNNHEPLFALKRYARTKFWRQKIFMTFWCQNFRNFHKG